MEGWDEPVSKKGLYVLFEGLPKSVIDSQVMLHCRDMKINSIIEFEIWSFACTSELYNKSKDRLAYVNELSQCKVRLFRGVRPGIPFSTAINAFLLMAKLLKYRPQHQIIHARTEYSASVCALLKLFQSFSLIWDCRGDSVAEARARYRGNGIKKKAHMVLATIINKWRVFISAKACSGAIFVSSPLKEVIINKIPDKPNEVIPCVASDELFYFNEELRKKTREELNITNNELIVLYSGSLSNYQCIDETLDLFMKLKKSDDSFKFIILTPDTEKARTIFSQLPVNSYIVNMVPLERMNRYLNAADYAIMLREPDALNAAASPTKFAEYCLAGLPVIMSDSVRDSYRLALSMGNLCSYKDGLVELNNNYDRIDIQERARKVLTRTSVLSKYSRIYDIV